jgi:UDP-N-acetylmuramoylalanine--D-glutamate ligase
MNPPAEIPPRVAILGLARSGQALADTLLSRGVAVSAGDLKPESEFDSLGPLRERGARLFFDGPAEEFLDGAGWLALSPGVPTRSPLVAAARARGLPVLSEFEIAWRIAESEAEGKNRWVAVTGTNGKSTTTAWIAEILRRAGRSVALAGNIGVPLSAFLAERAARDFVCELSSFQLETLERFRPDVAVVTNVTPDHLDRYESFAEYARAKERILANQETGDYAVLNADDPVTVGMRGRARRVLFSRRGKLSDGAFLEDTWVVWAEKGGGRPILPAGEVALPGAHNLENALAALAAVECLGTPDEAIREGLSEFAGLPHRSELVAEGGGVSWVDDSKGTNVDAAKKSIEGYRHKSLILILGGRDKAGDFAALAPEAARAARLVLTIGEAAEKIERALEGAVPLERCGTMEKAVRRAAEAARHGDTVLLSPACASFDQYANFEERGRHFASLARAAAERVRRGLEEGGPVGP